ncbi:hypothetical protein P153DRAFT_420054 [Dothidotthia symphoricarpi CBS 119687]|uniref:Uncharacterized protein n=1 Tax=Dothidotthia symphoricarpi CBS 119687 TaxID=1392245 RepID=A0A6A6AQX5_9PLEO|nr:uncharacterized protein P153DRAFT_420054 [Dothidotthia symphoricarpi CBS 119687]KAF2134339.1 hypothetical protein P153DRAFT_420054 [Dothidotthia symphoricarpi CBS 119687]
MYRRGDPRWNRTLQHITDNLEHANESAQENIYGFTQSYISPCFASVTHCVNACTAPCFPSHNDRRRHRGRSRGRAESSFDFYDDWEEDENDGLLGWGNDNLDRLLGGGGGGGGTNYGATAQPGRQNAMLYGQRNRDPRYNTPRRKSAPHDAGPDPTLIPSSSYFGFLGRLPFKIGGKGLRYKPSAADLVDHPGATRRTIEEQPLIEDSDEDAQDGSEFKGHQRQRSWTHTSGHTTDSLSSRGDIFPSEDELDDAVPLDDEFAMALERRATGPSMTDESSSRKDTSVKSLGGRSKRPARSRTTSSRHTRARHDDEDGDVSPLPLPTTDTEGEAEIDTLVTEEARLAAHEESTIHRKRIDAQRLAVQRGLGSLNLPPQSRSGSRSPGSTPRSVRSPMLRSPGSGARTPSGVSREMGEEHVA